MPSSCPAPSQPSFDPMPTLDGASHGSDVRGSPIPTVLSAPVVDPIPLDIVSTRRSTRDRLPSTRLRDYVCHTMRIPITPLATYPTRSESSSTSYPLSHYVNYDRFSPSYVSFLANVSAVSEPNTFSEDMRSPDWRHAMKSEIDALQHNNTWSMVDLPPGKRPIGCKWVFRIKRKSDGSIESYSWMGVTSDGCSQCFSTW